MLKITDEISVLGCKTQTKETIEKINSQRTEKEKSNLRTKYGISTSPNPFLSLPIDLHR